MTTTIGVLGGEWRGRVTPWGDIEGPGGDTITWHVAADDRWHTAADEPAVRQVAIDGTPVIETKLRIPGGDAIQRVWATADHGGLTVAEVENDSPMPIAVAFSGGGLLTGRPPTDVPIDGITLPTDTIVLPVGHRTRVRVARAHGPSPLDRLPDDVAGPNQVAGGWLAHAERASRLVLPDPVLATSVIADRCALALEAPDAADDGELLLGIGELVRMGARPEPWVIDVVSAAQRLVDLGRRGGQLASPPLWAAAWLLAEAREDGGAADIVSAIVRLRLPEDGSTRPPTPGAANEPPSWLARVSGPVRAAARAVRTGRPVEVDAPATTPSVGAGGRIERVEALVARPATRGVCALFPIGIDRSWWGSNFEAHGLRAGPKHRLSLGVRWHGDRPAVLWEVEGPPGLVLTGGAHDRSWRSSEPAGDALLAAPTSPT